MNDVNIFNDSNNIRHSKLSNNPNFFNEEEKVDSIELVDDISNKKQKNNNNNSLVDSGEEKLRTDIDINDENNINNIHTNEENIEKIDEESIHSNNSYFRRDSSINKSYENNIEKNEDDNKYNDKRNEPKNNLINYNEENINSKINDLKYSPEGMKENNY